MKERKVISEKKLYGNKWMDVLQREYDVGGEKKTYTFIKRSSSVIAIPLAADGNTILLRQFRYPTGMESLEFPMGGIDEGETIVDALKRELQEETNLHIKDFEEIGKFFPVPGLTDQVAYVFVVHVNEDLSTLGVKSDEEDIDGSMVMSSNEVFNLIRQGRVTDGFTLSASLFLKLYMEKE